MQSLLRSKLETDRKALLDLSLRNPLLSFRLSKARGVKVIQEQSADVYDLLVNGSKKLLFEDNGKKDGEEAESSELITEALQKGYTDSKLQTAESEKNLQKRLLKTYYDAAASLQEQGVNILFLALGMLNWFEDDASADPKMAPIVLVPVELERQNSNDRFRLLYTKADVESNLSLQAKLKADFGIKFPMLADADETDIESYFDAVAQAVQDKKRWNLERNAIYLGFFSFGKFMLFQDLDIAKWPADKQPVDHPLLQALLHTGFSDPAPTVGDGVFLDHSAAADNLIQVLDADSTQVQAMLAVDEGRNLVIQGPPGTGKSQTITNLIANAIAKGKKVLFVAEKMAALEVVKRRLDSVHLGDACMELHSHKANKKDLLQELKRSMELGRPHIDKLREEARHLDEYKRELNAYCAAVNEPVGQSGKSPFQIIGFLYQQKLNTDQSKLKTFVIPDIDQWGRERLHRAGDMADRIEDRLKSVGLPASLPFWGSQLKVVLPMELPAIGEAVVKSVANSKDLSKIIADLSRQCGIALPERKEDIQRWLVLFELAAKAPRLEDAQLTSSEWLSHATLIREALKIGREANALKASYDPVVNVTAWEADHMPVRQELMVHGRKWWKFLIGSFKAAMRTLGGWCRNPPPTTYVERLKLVDALIESKRLHEDLSKLTGLMERCFPKSWKGRDSDWPALEERASYLFAVHKAIASGEASTDILSILAKMNPAAAREAYDSLESAVAKYEHGVQSLLERIQFVAPESQQAGRPFLNWSYKDQLRQLEQWQGGTESLQLVASWNTLAEVAAGEGYGFLAKESESWQDAVEYLRESLEKTWHEHFIGKAFTERAPLQRFDQSTHMTILEKFRSGDSSVMMYHQAKAALAHFEQLPQKSAGGQVATLYQEFNKKARHKPIRKLMAEAGIAIQAIKPVFMMSPLSVANYLAPGTVEFDIVIFDEASQVRPIDAFGAILRGRQLVVVGDTRQLPPTSFFDKMVMDDVVDDDEDDSMSTGDMPSILSLCNAQRAPERMLRWHYRSRHESLISVSNHEFYESRLVVFPSPGDVAQLGLFYNHLPDTAYDRGGSRSNRQEAEAVADAVIEHARARPGKSLGVVAFSEAQKQAVMDAIEIRRKAHQELEPFFSTSVAEPFFVKNLESVQGDERDVIMISVGYGRDANRYVSMSFGPLNNEGGEKRLNVLITRAKERCEVFTNLSYDDIDLSRAKGAGVKAFKTFLKYAQTGILDIPQATGKDADSPFEDAVAGQLEGLGYKVEKQVGSNGFFIDLAIEDQEKPGRYLIGIECDGAAYHSSRSARDRDRLRQSALEGMGWTFHRIWSTDWFRHPERELKSLVEAIEKAKLKAPQHTRKVEAIKPIAIERQNIAEKPAEQIPKYIQTRLPAAIATNDFLLHPPGRLAEWLEQVVRLESPVHFDEAARRLVEAAGISKVGSRIRVAIQGAVRLAVQAGDIVPKGDFLWHASMTSPKVRDRSQLPPSARKIQMIAPEEIAEALVQAAKSSYAIGAEELIAKCGRMFGFARVTEEMRKYMSEVLDASLQAGVLRREGEWVKVG